MYSDIASHERIWSNMRMKHINRNTRIARVAPYSEQEERLSIQAATGEPGTLRRIRIPPAPPGTDSLKALKEDRRDDLDLQTEGF